MPGAADQQTPEISDEQIRQLTSTVVAAATPQLSFFAVIAKLFGSIGTLNTLILAGLYGVYWLISTGIPMHLAQIQSGYEKINIDNGKRLEAVESAHKDEVQALQAGFERRADRTESLLREIFQKPKGGVGAAAMNKGSDSPDTDGGGT
jgi:hypothetical protein